MRGRSRRSRQRGRNRREGTEDKRISFADLSSVDFVDLSSARQISSKLDLHSLNRKVRHNEQARSALAQSKSLAICKRVCIALAQSIGCKSTLNGVFHPGRCPGVGVFCP